MKKKLSARLRKVSNIADYGELEKLFKALDVGECINIEMKTSEFGKEAKVKMNICKVSINKIKMEMYGEDGKTSEKFFELTAEKVKMR